MARKRNLYDPKSKSFYRLSRTKLENFLRCARCFYLDRRLGVSQPPGFPFNLNSAVDELLKREFDDYRTKQEPHPYMQGAGIDAVPAQHPQLETWRQNFKGVSVDHEVTGFTFFGAIDDLWWGGTASIWSAITRPPQKTGRSVWMRIGRFHTSDRWKFISGCYEEMASR